MPEGVSYEGVFGTETDKNFAFAAPNAGLTMYTQLGMASRVSQSARIAPQKTASSNGVAGGIGSGSGPGVGAAVGGGSGGGTFRSAMAPPPPPSVAMPSVVPNGEPSPQFPGEKRTGERAVLESKLSPTLLEAFDCWQKLGVNCKLVKDGKVELQVLLTNNSEPVINQLKALGFAPSQNRPAERTIIGQLPLEKLIELAKMDSVRFVASVRRE
jgi:hypothetical protein